MGARNLVEESCKLAARTQSVLLSVHFPRELECLLIMLAAQQLPDKRHDIVDLSRSLLVQRPKNRIRVCHPVGGHQRQSVGLSIIGEAALVLGPRLKHLDGAIDLTLIEQPFPITE